VFVDRTAAYNTVWHRGLTCKAAAIATEDSFSAKKKAAAVFVDRTAAYNTVWHRGLTCKAAAIAT